ncbi:TATA element modulatory factor-like [Clytia hemisphaerica]|uniref:TATA element modulatory factor 1 TATA binding domain-containing protein n=1 Tax=Clytia hemisphaerica TaxID=252671 RepID=A0A7M5U9X2_9CNID
MSWFDPGALSKYSSYAKTALKTAQKNIDKVLEINDETEDTSTATASSITKVITGPNDIRSKHDGITEQETTVKPADHKRSSSRSPSRQTSVSSDAEQSSSSGLGDGFFSSFLNSSTPKRSSPASSPKTKTRSTKSSTDQSTTDIVTPDKASSTQLEDDFQTPPSDVKSTETLFTPSENITHISKDQSTDEFFTPIKKSHNTLSTRTLNLKEDSLSDTKDLSTLDKDESLIDTPVKVVDDKSKDFIESSPNGTKDNETIDTNDIDSIDQTEKNGSDQTENETNVVTDVDVDIDSKRTVESFDPITENTKKSIEERNRNFDSTAESSGDFLENIAKENLNNSTTNVPLETGDSGYVETPPLKKVVEYESDNEIEESNLINETTANSDNAIEESHFNNELAVNEKLEVGHILANCADEPDSIGNFVDIEKISESIDTEHALEEDTGVADKGFDTVDRTFKTEPVDSMVKEYSNEVDLTKEEDLEESVAPHDLIADGTSHLEQEFRRAQSLLETREEQLVEYSKQNISYQESIAVYRNQLEQMESMRVTEDTEMEQLRKEFTGRISESESKLKSVLRERDQLKLSLEETQTHLQQSADQQITSLTSSLIEKEERIKDLLEEGEALSKKELDSNNKIKKFRAKLKEVNAKNEASTKKIEEHEAKIETLKISLSEKENHLKEIDGERQKLERMTDSQEDEITLLKEKFDDLVEKHEATETTLKSAYMEIDKLNLEKAQQISEVNEANASAEVRSELEQKLKEVEKQSKFGKEELQEQLLDLQTEYSRLEQQSARKEENFKREIQDLHKRIEDGESRNQELSQSVTAVTKPLLRQIENLQHSHTNQSENWERIERNLTERVGQLQQEMLLSSEKERSATDIAQEMKSKVKSFDAQVKSLKSEKKKLQSSLEEETTKNREMEEFVQKHKNTTEKQLKKLKLRYEDIVKERAFLEEQLSTEKVKYENDILQLNAKLSSQQEQYNLQRQQSSNRSLNNSRRNSGSSITLEDREISSFTNEVERPSLAKRHQRNLSSTSSLNGSILSDYSMNTATAESMERLQRQLKRRDGEVYVLQEEVKTLEKTKASLAQELVNLSNQIELLESDSQELVTLKASFKDLESRYGAVLQMYGEKEEETEELKMDLQDIRNMYKQQIQQLLGGS